MASSRGSNTPHLAQPPHPKHLHGHIAHVTRGRVRLRLNARDPQTLESVKARLHTLPAVHHVDVRPQTGSVIVHHSNANPEFMQHLRKLIADTAIFTLQEKDDPVESAKQLTAVERDAVYLLDHSKSGEVLVRYAEHLNRAVKHATDGWVDLRLLFPASVGFCALAFSTVETAPLWVPLALFSFQSFSHLHEPRPVLARSQPPIPQDPDAKLPAGPAQSDADAAAA